MSQTRDEIEAHRDQARSDLHSNLRELERRAQSAMDWKQQFEARPGTLLAVAFGGGIALSLLVGGRVSTRRRGREGNSELWDRVKGALIGVVAAKVSDYVGHLIPGAGGLAHPAQERLSPDMRGIRR